MARTKSPASADSTATIGFEATLWLAADSRSVAETASRRLPAWLAQRGNIVESQGGTAMRDSATLISEASPREFRAAKHHRGDISVYGQESNATTRRLAIMNLAIRGIETDFGPEHADTFRRDLHPDLRADTATRVSAKPKPRSHSAGLLRSERQLLANPPFNDSDWFRKDDDVRWQFGELTQYAWNTQSTAIIFR